MPRIWSVTWDRVGVLGPCSYQSHSDLGGLCYHEGHGDVWVRADAEGHVWVHGPAEVGVCYDIYGQC